MEAVLPLPATPTAVAHETGLADLPTGTDAWVLGLRMEAAAEQASVLLRLLEIGFLPGERVHIVARAFPGGDPLAVRIGRTTFALRKNEAALVRISTLAPAQGLAA